MKKAVSGIMLILLILTSTLILAFSVQPVTSSSIVIDGDMSDWVGIEPIINDSLGDSKGAYDDIGRVWTIYEEGYFFVLLEVVGQASSLFNELFFDVDCDPSTGYVINDIGADYMARLEALYDLYRYSNGDWLYITSLEGARVDALGGDSVEASVPIVALGSPSIVNTVFSVGPVWGYEIDTAPDIGHVIMTSSSRPHVGVKVGDWAKYAYFNVTWISDDPEAELPYAWMDINNTQWLINSVQNTSRTDITFQCSVRFENATESTSTLNVNVEVGSGNGTMWFISADLMQGDIIYNSTDPDSWLYEARINETIFREYTSTLRETNHLNLTGNLWKFFPAEKDILNIYWDKETGVLCEFTFEGGYEREGYTTFYSLSWKIAETNLWKTINHYAYEINVYGESYFIGIETDGVINNLSYTNFTFSLDWSSQGSYTKITLPKTLNNTSIKVMYHWMIQGWDENPQISTNDTHYFVFGEGSLEGCIVWVCFGEPKIELDISASAISLGYYVNITGKVTYRNHLIIGIGVYIGWSSGGSLNEISTVFTSTEGAFNVSWMPHATGTFYIIAKLICPWLPDEADAPYSYACLSISPPFEQHVFSVVSNSTISSLTFNSTENILSFSAEGPTGTKGYARVFIAKELVANISQLRVYIDGNLTDYNATSADDSWLLYFTYEHSTHMIEIIVPEFPSILILPLFIIFSTIATIFAKGKIKRKSKSRCLNQAV